MYFNFNFNASSHVINEQGTGNKYLKPIKLKP